MAAPLSILSGADLMLRFTSLIRLTLKALMDAFKVRAERE